MQITTSSGISYPVSKHSLINDINFDTDEDVLDYILNNLSTVEIFKIVTEISAKKAYIHTHKSNLFYRDLIIFI